jgi:hypothetical protein
MADPDALVLALIADALATGGGGDGETTEHVVLAGEPYVLRHTPVTGEPVAWRLWRSRFFDRVPGCLDHGTVGMAFDGRGLTVLERDLRPWLVPDGGEPVALHVHARFLDHLAALHATFWGWEGAGWVVPRCALGVPPGRAGSLHEALGRTPATVVHGGPRLANLGVGPDGRTVLLGWDAAGTGPACLDLARYLAADGARLLGPKEEAIAAYRDGLERRGIGTAGWWERQLGLSLLAVSLEGAGCGPDRAWWQRRADEGAAFLA